MPLPRTARNLAGTLTASALAAGCLVAPPSAAAATATSPSVLRSAGVPATARASTAATRTAADRRIARMLRSRATTRRFGARFSGTVLDAAAGTRVWSRNGGLALMPASNAKLVTAANALTVFGAGHRFRTTTWQGTTRSHVYLVGGGDPTVSSRQLDRLAATTAKKLEARGAGFVRVFADDSLFPTPTLAHGWKASYVPADITPVRALVRDQRDLHDTTADAASYFTARLRAHGMRTGYGGRGRARAGATRIATTVGGTVGRIVARMLMNSDNEMAEAVHKLVGIDLGRGATWRGAARAQREQMARNHLAMTALYDGSGLSRADRLTSSQLARVLAAGFHGTHRTSLAPLRSTSSLPTAGRTGTLRAAWGRFTARSSRCAAGRVWAKTGTLDDAAALSGWTRGRDGRVKVFSFLVNGRRVTRALRQDLDMLAATVTGCT